MQMLHAHAGEKDGDIRAEASQPGHSDPGPGQEILYFFCVAADEGRPDL